MTFFKDLTKNQEYYFFFQGRACNQDTEICCQLPRGQSSFDILLPNGSKKTLSASINELISTGEGTVHSEGSEEGASEFNLNNKPRRNIGNRGFVTPDYSDVHFDSDVRFGTGFQGDGYLPPDSK